MAIPSDAEPYFWTFLYDRLSAKGQPLTIRLLCKKREDMAVEAELRRGAGPLVPFTQELAGKLREVDEDRVRENVTGERNSVYWENSLNRLKQASLSGGKVPLNQLITGLFGPLLKPDLATQNYNANMQFYIEMDWFRSLLSDNERFKFSEFKKLAPIKKVAKEVFDSRMGGGDIEHRTWIFQANPKLYDLSGALKELDTISWAVNQKQYADDIASGDLVYLWESGSEAGITAVARVVEGPEESTDSPQEARFWLEKPTSDEPRLRVRLDIDEVLLNRVLRTEIEQIPALKNLSILRAPQGTNFKVYPRQAEAIARVIKEAQADEEDASQQRFWIELTDVWRIDRSDRQEGEYRLGAAIWSPKTAKGGRDIYGAIRQVKPGDVVFHLVDRKQIRGLSIANSTPEDFVAPEGTAWAGVPSNIVQLRDYAELDPAIERSEFLDDENREFLRDILKQYSGLFYNRKLELNQGCYLSQLPPPFVAYLDRIYSGNTSGKHLPHVDLEGLEDLLDDIPELLAGEQTATESNPEYTLAKMADETGFDESQLRRWVRAINRKGQAVLYGPPGTGKTFVAERLARHLIGGGSGVTEVVQFHPAYAYEDFIQGIRPQTREDGSLDYSMEPGRFLEFCERAGSRDGMSVLIIDEINRANLSRVFGELMFLLEYRNRRAPLAGGGELAIPENVLLLGTMNTADRSIALVDHALRRRFAFLPVFPNFEVLRQFHEKTGFNVGPLVAKLQQVNARIADRNYEVGIAYFLRENLAEDLEDIWRMEIEPYLEEFFFDQPEKADQMRWDKVCKDLIVD